MAKPGRRRQSGQATLEMALTFPLVCVVIMGCLELGFAFNAYLTLVSAAREGARAGAVYLYDSSYSQAVNDQNRASGTGTATPYAENIRDTVASSMGILKTVSPYFSKTTDVTITYNPSANPMETRKGSFVSVQVVYRHEVLSKVISSLPNITMTAQASARIE